MSKLRGVIFGIRNVLLQDLGNGKGKTDPHLFEEVGRLVQYLRKHDITPIVLANHDWTVTRTDGIRVSLKEALEKQWGSAFEWYIGRQGGTPAKQTAAALQAIRNKVGLQPNETLYLGNSESDMQSAVNGKTLFLNALWYGEGTRYGFHFQTPKEVARFIDTFCLRDHHWYFKVEDGVLRVYALAPYSTYLADYKEYSEDFIETVKKKLGDEEDVDFWGKYLCTSMYFSGLYDRVDYITPYPGHTKGSCPRVLERPMAIFAKCFRTRFIPDLILRHTTSIESKLYRDTVDHFNQLNTICLHEKPEKKPGEAYTSSPLKRGKTVLVVDDILSNGLSFEAARAYLCHTGADVVCVAFLKAMKREYRALQNLGKLPNGSYKPNAFKTVPLGKTYSYYGHVIDQDAPSELSKKLDRYPDWDWI